MQIEFCIEDAAAAIAAQEYGIDRIEVCSDLAADGLTPDSELLKACRLAFPGEVYAMIRPRAGNFVYSESELKQMQKEIKAAADCGADGVVFGLLKENNDIDSESCELLLQTAAESELGVTFHRAFDVCSKPLSSLEKIINLGFNRILTSGQKPTAIEGLELISQLVKKSEGRIDIMAGSGVSQENARSLFNTEIHALHFSIHQKSLWPSDPQYIDRKKVNGIFEKLGLSLPESL